MFSDSCAFESPKQVIEALAALSGQGGVRSIELDFSGIPTSVLDADWDGFCQLKRPVYLSGMQHITAVTLSHDWNDENNDTGPARQICADRWLRMLKGALRLNSLHLTRGCTDAYCLLLSTIFSSLHTWPALKSLWVAMDCNWSLPGIPHEEFFDYQDSNLIAFLDRHSGSLTDLKLINATGIDFYDSEYTAASLRTTLQHIQTSLSRLLTASITVVLDSSVLRIYSFATDRRPNWRVDDQEYATKTELDELAMELGANKQYYEHELPFPTWADVEIKATSFSIMSSGTMCLISRRRTVLMGPSTCMGGGLGVTCDAIWASKSDLIAAEGANGLKAEWSIDSEA